RLVHFIALAYLVATAPSFGRFIAPVVRGAFGLAVQSLGRNSLAIFAAGSLMSACGQAALAAASPHASKGIEQFAGLAYTVASIAALFAIAHWIECRNDPARAAGSSIAPALSRAWRALRSSYSR
ncbi:MAG TPA: OpgC domain-containing protein, partial [Roseiarcus sp.]